MGYFETAKNETGHLDSHLNTVILTIIVTVITIIIMIVIPPSLPGLPPVASGAEHSSVVRTIDDSYQVQGSVRIDFLCSNLHTHLH